MLYLHNDIYCHWYTIESVSVPSTTHNYNPIKLTTRRLVFFILIEMAIHWKSGESRSTKKFKKTALHILTSFAYIST